MLAHWIAANGADGLRQALDFLTTAGKNALAMDTLASLSEVFVDQAGAGAPPPARMPIEHSIVELAGESPESLLKLGMAASNLPLAEVLLFESANQ